MKALVLDKPGTPETLYPSDVEQPKPGPDEVRVKVQAVGLNPVDYKLAASGFPGWSYPFILGLDVAGIIDAVGPNVEEWQPGDPVYYHGDMTKPGGYGQYAIVTTRTLAWLPDGLSYTDAAALPCAGFTAYQAIHRKLRVQKGNTILVQGGAGGVGGFAVQLAKAAGLEVIATCSRHNTNFVRDLGATEIIDYQKEDVAQAVREITNGRGVDYIVDTVSPESATKGLQMLAFNGQMACVAGLPNITSLSPYEKAFSLHEVALGGAYVTGDEQALDDLARIGMEFGALAAKGVVKPMVEETVALEDIPDALVRLSMRHVRGKIVAKIPQPGGK
ncbi:MAG TPA: zinc-binding dehydrogenase [Oculatellaceae cyanobacterium]